MFENFGFSLGAKGRVRHLRQTQSAECGIVCLAMVAQHHEYDVSIAALRRRFSPSTRGIALKSLMTIADRINLAPRALKVPLEELNLLHLPAILHWDLSHYVVIEKIDKGKVLIHDPAQYSAWMTYEEVSKHFTGVALELRPTGNFSVEEESTKIKIAQLWSSFSGLKRAVFQLLLLSILVQIAITASPYFMQLVVDKVIDTQDYNLLFVLALGFGFIILFQVISSFLRAFVILWAGTHLSYGLAVDLARRLFRLPIAWFEKRHVGDVLSRFQSVIPIQEFLLTGAIAAFIDGGMAFFTFAIMLYYSPLLAFISLLFLTGLIIWRTILFMAEKRAIEETIVSKAIEQSNLIETIQGITTLRLFNRESYRHSFWQSKLTNSMNAEVRLSRIGIWQQSGNMLLTGLENVVTIYIAANLVLAGGFSVGMIFAFIAYQGQFSAKSLNLVEQFIKFRLLSLHIDRLSDIALAKEDVSFMCSTENSQRLIGRIELKNVSYRYSADEPLVLDNVNLVVEPGEHLAITGPSGGGKSTLVKLLLGLVEPDSGEILVDGVPLRLFGYQNFHEQTSAILQEEALFAGSIADNIALFDDKVDMNRVQSAALAGAFHKDVTDMPLQYETLIGESGTSLSGGQKQRLMFARALYREPKLLVIDEGTAHLDSYNERLVNDSICELGITRISIAHRQETLKIADRVVFLNRKVVD
jgi:ATP-binding cassette, subfamily B, bacterial CvaB/MchF/RaxB